MNLRIIQCTLVLVFGTFMFGCSSNTENNFNQINQLSSKEQIKFTEKIIRYLGRKPENASHELKFDTYFDEHYAKEFKKYDLEYYHKNKENKYFFVYTCIAPSLHLKKTAIGGYATFNSAGKVEQYVELFRTWKQDPKTLKPITDVLFEKIVSNQDLLEYQTKNSTDLGWIEFPNDEVHFDTKKMHWVSTRIDPLESFYLEKIKQTEELIKKQDKNKKIN